MQSAKTLEALIASTDYGADEAAVLRLYQAYFNRTPDLGGAKYWAVDILNNGHTIEEIAGWMSGSAEFVELYDGTSNEEYVSAIYANVLGRDFDETGYLYWLGLLNDGQLDRAGIVFWITQNNEFITAYPFT